MIVRAYLDINPSLIQKENFFEYGPQIINIDSFERRDQSYSGIEFEIVVVDAVNVLISFLYYILIYLHHGSYLGLFDIFNLFLIKFAFLPNR